MNNQANQNALRDFNLRLNNKFNVPVNSLIDMTIDYDIENPYVSGSFVIETEFDLGEALQFDGEMSCDLQAKDCLDNKINEKFVVFDFSCVRDSSKNFKSYGKFLDIVSWELSKKYISKGFVNCDMKTVLTDIDIAADIFKKTSKKTDFDETKQVENFVVSCNKNLLSIQKRMKEYFNCVYFHTHDKIKLKKWENLFKGELLKVGDKEITYKSPPEASVPLFDIIEYKSLSVKGIDTTKYGVKVKSYSYDPLNRTNKPFEYDLIQANKDLNNLEKIQDNTNGIKTIYTTNINPEEQTKYIFQRNLMFNSQFMLLASGFFCVNPGLTVNLSVKGMENDVENISGKYLITRVTDSIAQGYMTQKVVLSRPSPANKNKYM